MTAALLLCAHPGSGAAVQRSTPSVSEVESAIERSGVFLLGCVRGDGSFVYRVNMDPDVTVKEKYNVLRHAGAVYALCRYYDWGGEREALSAIRRSASFLRRRTMAPVAGRNGLLALWSNPEMTRSGKPLRAKLGGAGLGLVAFACADDAIPDLLTRSELRSLGEFVLYMQKREGSFYSLYVPSAGGRQDAWESLYYPGEAALGLLMLQEKDREGPWAGPAAKALMYLAKQREGKRAVPADHWALLATAELCEQGIAEAQRDLLVEHGRQICRTMLGEQVLGAARGKLSGGFSADGRTTPTSIRLEGLLASLAFLPDDDPLRAKVLSAVRSGVAFLLRAQVKEGRFAGAFPRAIARRDLGTQDAEDFNRRATEVRIDYVQHALCTLIDYRGIVAQEEGDAP